MVDVGMVVGALQVAVVGGLVGDDGGFLGDVGAHDGQDRLAVHSVDVEAAGFARATIDERENGHFVVEGFLRLRHAFLASDEGLVGLGDRAGHRRG